MPTKEPSDEDEPRPSQQPEQDTRPSDEDGADREEPAPERRVARVRDRDWGFLALALPQFLALGSYERRSR
jgi:hypothetical protein